MSSIQIFYHMYCVNDCLNRFVNTYNKIVSSSLIQKVEKINVVLVGPEKEKIKEELKFYNKVETFIKPNSETEADTLKMIQQYSKNNNGKVLYLHSKGVTKPKHKNIQDWTNLMEYFLIEKHESCIQALDSHDVCGVNYLPGKPHFSGNFWWSTTKHINRLIELKAEKIDRLYCEYWLFDIQDTIKRKEIYNSGINHYCNPYPREKYTIEK